MSIAEPVNSWLELVELKKSRIFLWFCHYLQIPYFFQASPVAVFKDFPWCTKPEAFKNFYNHFSWFALVYLWKYTIMCRCLVFSLYIWAKVIGYIFGGHHLIGLSEKIAALKTSGLSRSTWLVLNCDFHTPLCIKLHTGNGWVSSRVGQDSLQSNVTRVMQAQMTTGDN